MRKWPVISGQREFILKLSQNGRRSVVPSCVLGLLRGLHARGVGREKRGGGIFIVQKVF